MTKTKKWRLTGGLCLTSAINDMPLKKRETTYLLCIIGLQKIPLRLSGVGQWRNAWYVNVYGYGGELDFAWISEASKLKEWRMR